MPVAPRSLARRRRAGARDRRLGHDAGSDRSAAPTAGAAVTNYLTYVHGTRGKADPKKSQVYIGWVNQQGGQVVIGGLATAGAELAVKT